MVKDNRFTTPRSNRLRRRRSWKDTLRGFTSGNEKELQTASSTSPKTRASTSALKTSSSHNLFYTRKQKSVADDQGSLADAESEEDEDYNHRKEEDRPLRARVRYAYPHIMTPPIVTRSQSMLEEQQKELLAAVEEANTKAIQAVGGDSLKEGSGEVKEPIGTRLTMTSRTGYFQDRIVSPSMMRAMAILYIGPHRNPDFATDYHISPILAPEHLLAQFPPLLLQCGEKDPFVDDTVIFAGRVREAKRARKIELDLAISGKSARFGEGLRMSGIESHDGSNLSPIKKERDKLASETEDDWVQMVLFSDWSHGYLQMPTLMSEARTVIEELAEWINIAFNKDIDLVFDDDRDPRLATKRSTPKPLDIATESSETETDDSGITFVPKRYQNGPSVYASDEPRENNTPSPKSMTVSDQNGYPVSLWNENDEHDGLGCGIEPLVPHEGEYPSTMRTTPQPPPAPKSNGPRQGGTQITETELMRRRRLLDSHIFV